MRYKGHKRLKFGLMATMLPAGMCCSAAILVDTSPGTGAPLAVLGGHIMGAFPNDATPEGTMVTELTPPAAAPVTGNLHFTTPVEHMEVGGLWDTWSHGYTGDVYFNEDKDLMVFELPVGTLAFSMYIQPNLKDLFHFGIASGVTVAHLDIDGDGGAAYVGFYTDDPADPLTFVYVEQTTNDSDGFAVGEFMINVPEPGTWAMCGALGLLGFAALRRIGRA